MSVWKIHECLNEPQYKHTHNEELKGSYWSQKAIKKAAILKCLNSIIVLSIPT